MEPSLQQARSLDDLPDFFSVSEFSSVFGVSRATAYRMAEQGKFPCLRIGRRVILSRDHLKQWVEDMIGGTGYGATGKG